MKQYILLSILLLSFLIFSNTSVARGAAGKIFAGIFSGVVVDALGKAYDSITGKTDIKILRYELNIIKNKIPEMKDSIESLMEKINENTNTDEYMRIISIEKINLMNKINNNTINIKKIKDRLMIIENKINNKTNKFDDEENEIKEKTGHTIIVNYLSDATKILSLSGVKKEKSMNLLWSSLLSERMKKKLPWSSFRSWWGKTVVTVSYSSIKHTGKNLFDLEIRYNLKNNTNICKIDTIFFKKEISQWKIHDMRYGAHTLCKF